MAERELCIGDVCIGQNASWYKKWNGTEVTILSISHGFYEVDLPHPSGVGNFYVLRYQLRLKCPKEDDKAWAESKIKQLLNEQEFSKNSAKENDLVTA